MIRQPQHAVKPMIFNKMNGIDALPRYHYIKIGVKSPNHVYISSTALMAPHATTKAVALSMAARVYVRAGPILTQV